jgi:hypothetical protein
MSNISLPSCDGEWWINVYEDYKGVRWFGTPKSTHLAAKHVANACLIYRIHVRLK